MKSFDKENLPKVRNELNAILKAYADKNGLTIDIGNIKFSAGEFKTTLDVKIVGAVTQSDKALERIMSMYQLGKIGNDGSTLTGYNSRAHAYPVQYNDINGNSMKCSIESAKRRFSI